MKFGPVIQTEGILRAPLREAHFPAGLRQSGSDLDTDLRTSTAGIGRVQQMVAVQHDMTVENPPQHVRHGVPSMSEPATRTVEDRR